MRRKPAPCLAFFGVRACTPLSTKIYGRLFKRLFKREEKPLRAAFSSHCLTVMLQPNSTRRCLVCTPFKLQAECKTFTSLKSESIRNFDVLAKLKLMLILILSAENGRKRSGNWKTPYSG